MPSPEAQPEDEDPENAAENAAAVSDYRRFLVDGAQNSQAALDKALLALSGGALGISVIFIKDIIGEQPVVKLWALIFAWAAWAVSVLFVLASFEVASRANRVAIARCDDGSIYEHAKAPGGVFSYLTRGFNICAALSFVIGVASMLAFVEGNLTERNKRYEQQGQAHSNSVTEANTEADPTPDPNSIPSSDPRGRSEGYARQGIRPAAAPAEEEVTSP